MKYKISKFKILLCLALSCILFTILWFYPEAEAEQEENVLIENQGQELFKRKLIPLNEIFYYKEKYQEALLGIEALEKKNNIASLIVPHHLVASDMIMRQLKEASGRSISRVVIIGPNHENIGGDAVNSIASDWETPFGTLRHDDYLVNKFLLDFGVNSDEAIFENEHSIGGIAPFVRDIFGDIEFMPIVVSSYAEFNDLIKLNDWLDENLPADALIIYSLDFSHYLSKSEADKKDSVIRELIENMDIGAVMKLNNDYVDSPFILALSLLRAKNNNLAISINENANSFDYALVPPTETTSYFTVSFMISAK